MDALVPCEPLAPAVPPLPVYRCSFRDARGAVLHIESIECADTSIALEQATRMMDSVSGDCRSVHVHDGFAVVGVRYVNPAG